MGIEVVLRLNLIQYLRAIAALMVVYYHAASKVALPVGFSAAGVDVFFVISGYIMWSVASENTPGQFLLNRIIRIVPLYWFYTAALLMSVAMLPSAFPRFHTDKWHVFSSFIFIPSRSPGDGEVWPVLVQGWTLNYEMFFYVAFAACLLVKRPWRLAAMCATMTSFVLMGLLYRGQSAIVLTYTDPLLLEFALGMLLAWVTTALPPSRFISTFAVFGGGAGFFIGASLGLAHPRLLLWGLPALLIVGGLVSLEKSANIEKLYLPALLGDASYSIYLAHTFVVSALGKVLTNHPIALILASLSASSIVGVASFYILERPFLKFGRGLTRSVAKQSQLNVSSPRREVSSATKV